MKAVFVLAAVLASALANDTRITGATDATINQFPWMVAVRHSRTFMCGGVLISPTWVLTSAECISKYSGSDNAWSIFAGGLTLLNSKPPSDSTRVEVSVKGVYVNPNFQTRDTRYSNNLGLLELSTAVSGANISPAQLPASGFKVADDSTAELSGWGGGNSRVVNNLQYAVMNVLGFAECTTQVGNGVILTDSEVCTVAAAVNAACWYDHGGPLVQGDLVVGILGFADCNDITHPSVYANPGYPELRNWITSVTGL